MSVRPLPETAGNVIGITSLYFCSSTAAHSQAVQEVGLGEIMNWTGCDEQTRLSSKWDVRPQSFSMQSLLVEGKQGEAE